MALAQCLFLLSLSVQVYRVWYNYFDYKFEWSPLEISIFISTFGLSSAIVSGALIRVLIPRCMLETQAILLGVSLQVSLVSLSTVWQRAESDPSTNIIDPRHQS